MRVVAGIAVLALLGFSGPGQVQDKDDGQVLIEDFLRNVTTISGRFEQQLIDAEDNVVEISAGTLDIERPGRFRWSYSQPYRQELIADDHNQVVEQRLAQHLEIRLGDGMGKLGTDDFGAERV